MTTLGTIIDELKLEILTEEKDFNKINVKNGYI